MSECHEEALSRGDLQLMRNTRRQAVKAFVFARLFRHKHSYIAVGQFLKTSEWDTTLPFFFGLCWAEVVHTCNTHHVVQNHSRSKDDSREEDVYIDSFIVVRLSLFDRNAHWDDE